MASNQEILRKIKLTSKLGAALMKMPQMRLCQFLTFLTKKDDNFYTTDEELDELLTEFLKKPRHT